MVQQEVESRQSAHGVVGLRGSPYCVFPLHNNPVKQMWQSSYEMAKLRL